MSCIHLSALKVYAVNFFPFGTTTDPATATKSNGLPSDAQLAAFFAHRLENYPDK